MTGPRNISNRSDFIDSFSIDQQPNRNRRNNEADRHYIRYENLSRAVIPQNHQYRQQHHQQYQYRDGPSINIRLPRNFRGGINVRVADQYDRPNVGIRPYHGGPVVRGHAREVQRRHAPYPTNLDRASSQNDIPTTWNQLMQHINAGTINLGGVAQFLKIKNQSNPNTKLTNEQVNELLDRLPVDLSRDVPGPGTMINWARIFTMLPENVDRETIFQVANKTAQLLQRMNQPFDWTGLGKLLIKLTGIPASYKSLTLRALRQDLMPRASDNCREKDTRNIMAAFSGMTSVGTGGKVLLGALVPKIPQRQDHHEFTRTLIAYQKWSDWPIERIALYQSVLDAEMNGGTPESNAVACFLSSLKETTVLPQEVDALLSTYLEWVNKNRPSFNEKEISMMFSGFQSNRQWSQGRNDCYKMLTSLVKSGLSLSEKSVSTFLSTFGAVTSLSPEGKELRNALLPVIKASSIDSSEVLTNLLVSIALLASEEAKPVLDAIKSMLSTDSDKSVDYQWENVAMLSIPRQQQQKFLAECLNALKKHLHLPVAREIANLAYQRGCAKLQEEYGENLNSGELAKPESVSLVISALLWSWRGIALTDEFEPAPKLELHGLSHFLAETAVRQYLEGVPGEEKPSGFLDQEDETICQIITGQSDAMKAAVEKVFDELKEKHGSLELITKYGSVIIRKMDRVDAMASSSTRAS